MEKTKIAIIGAGPAGYTAAVYNARALLEPIQFAGIKAGGQLMNTTDVENYPGFKEGIMGPDLMFAMREQAQRFGADIRDKYVVAVDFSERPFKLWTQMPDNVDPQEFEQLKGDELQQVLDAVKSQPHDIEADAVIVATGAVSRMLGVPGEDRLFGKGVSTCAVCDAAFYRDRKAIVVGGGDSAMEDALALSKFATEVIVMHRRDEFRASKIMQERVLNHDKITVMWNTNVEEVLGEDKVEAVRVNQDGETKEISTDGIFMAIGHIPVTGMFKDQLELDQHGFIVTRTSFSKPGIEQAQAHVGPEGMLKFPTTTSVEGVFAAGDVVDIRYWQAVTAAGQGCMAAIDAERWLESQE